MWKVLVVIGILGFSASGNAAVSSPSNSVSSIISTFRGNCIQAIAKGKNLTSSCQPIITVLSYSDNSAVLNIRPSDEYLLSITVIPMVKDSSTTYTAKFISVDGTAPKVVAASDCIMEKAKQSVSFKCNLTDADGQSWSFVYDNVVALTGS